MTPYYDDGTVSIYVGDCRIVLPALAREGLKVAMTITSPPYNVGIAYDKWNDSMGREEYIKFTEDWIQGCFDVTPVSGRIAINYGNPIVYGEGKRSGISTPYLSVATDALIKAGFTAREYITWVKSRAETFEGAEDNFSGRNTAWGSWQSPSNPFCRSFSEFILLAHRDEPKLQWKGQSDLTPEEFMTWTRNVWMMPAETNRDHPAPYPPELPRRLMKLYTYPGDTILDPFGGSGTTGWVAKHNNRKAVLIELSEGYAEQAANRIRQNSFFDKV